MKARTVWLTLSLVFLIVGCTSKRGIVVIHTRPTDATIYVNDVKQGTSPVLPAVVLLYTGDRIEADASSRTACPDPCDPDRRRLPRASFRRFAAEIVHQIQRQDGGQARKKRLPKGSQIRAGGHRQTKTGDRVHVGPDRVGGGPEGP